MSDRQFGASAKVYHEGILLKRQRGRNKAYPHFNLKFQERFCRISQPSLKYYDPKHIRGQDTPKGDLHVQHIKIVENVTHDAFGKDFCFQVGDQSEVMYFIASSNEEREKWMKELRQFATDNGNEMLERYHSGVFVRRNFHSNWSCCGSIERASVGCQTATLESQPFKMTGVTLSHSQPHEDHSEPCCSAISVNAVTSVENESNSNITGSTISSTSTLTPSYTEPVTIQSSQSVTDTKLHQTPHNQSFTVGTADSGRGSCQWDNLTPPSNAKPNDYVILQRMEHYSNEDDHLMYAFIPSAKSTTSETTLGCSGITMHNPLLKGEEFLSQDSLHDLESQNEMMTDDTFNLHSYTPFHSLHTSGSVTALAFPDASTLISGSTESNVQIWNVPALTLEGTVKTAGETSSLSLWSSVLAIGSNPIQLVDLSDKQIMVPLQNPLIQLVAFGPQGYLATANSESKTVKVWPPPSQVQQIFAKPIWSSGCILDSAKNILCSLSASTNEEQPWLVVGESAGCAHLLNWKEEEKTYHILFPEGNRVGKTATAVSHCGQTVAAGCDRCLVSWEIDSRNILFVDTNYSGDQTISSLCFSPDDAHLAVGMSTGEVVVYDPWSGNPFFTLEGHQNGISTMLYSGCGSYFAAGYNNGRIQLWTIKTSSRTKDINKIVKEPIFCSDLPLIGRVEDQIQNREEEYIMEFLDYKIVVPANATSEGRKVLFQTGEMPFGPVGPFKFPPNTKPVSSIVWFHSNRMSDLQKPIKIVLSHCLDCTSEDDLKQLVFMKAGDNDFTINEIGEKEFNFHIVREEEKEGEPFFTSEDGTLTTRYNSWHAICEELSEVSREKIDRARYCLIQAVPKLMTEGKYKVRFILSYFLRSCMKVIEKQYSGTHDVNHQTVTFTTQGPDPCLRVEFERNLEKGWIVACPSGSSIEVNEVYFLDILEKNQEDFTLALEYKQYPPNIVLDAHGGNATGDTVLKVKLTGADKKLEQEVILKKLGPKQTAESAVDTEQTAECESAMDTVASLSECHSYSVTTATQTSLQCSDNSNNAVAGNPVHYYEPLQNTSPEPQQPHAFPAQYFENHRHLKYSSSSSPAQSVESTQQPIPET